MGCWQSVPSSLPEGGAADSGTEEEVAWDIKETSDIQYRDLPGEEYVNEYKLHEVLGSGSYGYVRRCERIDSDNDAPHKMYAIKFLSKSKLRKMKDTVFDDNGLALRVDGTQKLDAEIRIMRYLFHRNVCIIFEVMNSPLENDVLLVTEYMAGGSVMFYDRELKKYIFSTSAAMIMNGHGYNKLNSSRNDLFPEAGQKMSRDIRDMTDDEAVSFSLDLLNGLKYLHSKGICHRDIKPDNLLIHASGSLRIGDFGCSKLHDLNSNPNGMVSNTAGTIAFWPPESIVRDSNSPSNNDIRGAEFSPNVNELHPMAFDTLSPSDSQSHNDFDLDSLPPMIESYDMHDLDSLPPITNHDVDDLPPMDNSRSPSSGAHQLNDLPTLTVDIDEPGVKYSSFAADMWAAGVTIHCFLYGSLPIPIEGLNPINIMDKISDYIPPDTVNVTNGTYSNRPAGANFVWSSLMKKDPLSRMTLSQALRSEWLHAEKFRRTDM